MSFTPIQYHPRHIHLTSDMQDLTHTPTLLFFTSLPLVRPLSSPSDSHIPFSLSFSLPRSRSTRTEPPLTIILVRERLRSSRVALRVRGLLMFSSVRGRVLSSAVRRVFCSSTVERVLVRSRVGRIGISGCGSVSDSETASTVGDATWDLWRLDLGLGWTRVTEDMNEPDLERGLGVGLGVDAFEVGLGVDLGEASTFAFAIALALSFFLMLALRSLETDTFRLRLRP